MNQMKALIISSDKKPRLIGLRSFVNPKKKYYGLAKFSNAEG